MVTSCVKTLAGATRVIKVIPFFCVNVEDQNRRRGGSQFSSRISRFVQGATERIICRLQLIWMTVQVSKTNFPLVSRSRRSVFLCRDHWRSEPIDQSHAVLSFEGRRPISILWRAAFILFILWCSMQYLQRRFPVWSGALVCSLGRDSWVGGEQGQSAMT